MINWVKLYDLALDRQRLFWEIEPTRTSKLVDWIANRINRRLAGYEAMKKELIGRSTWNDRDAWVLGNSDCAREALSICQDAEKEPK
jgi:hypothetical protein